MVAADSRCELCHGERCPTLKSRLWSCFSVTYNFLGLRDVNRDRIQDVLVLYKSTNTSSNSSGSCLDEGDLIFEPILGFPLWWGSRDGGSLRAAQGPVVDPGIVGHSLSGLGGAAAHTHPLLPRFLDSLHLCGRSVRSQRQCPLGKASSPGWGPRGLCQPPTRAPRGSLHLFLPWQVQLPDGRGLIYRSAIPMYCIHVWGSHWEGQPGAGPTCRFPLHLTAV